MFKHYCILIQLLGFAHLRLGLPKMEGATLHSALAIGSEDAGIQCRHCGAIIYGIQVAHGAGGYLHYGCKIEVEAMQQRASEEVRKRSEAKYELQLRRVVHKMSWSTARAKKVRRWHGGGVLGHCDSGCGGALEECSFVFQYACVVLAAVAAVSHCSMRALGWFVQRVAVLVAVVGSERIWHEKCDQHVARNIGYVTAASLYYLSHMRSCAVSPSGSRSTAAQPGRQVLDVCVDVVDRAASACISCMGVVAAGIQVTIGAFAAGEWSPTFIVASLLASEHPLLQLCVVRSLHSVAGIHRSAALDLCIIGVWCALLYGYHSATRMRCVVLTIAALLSLNTGGWLSVCICIWIGYVRPAFPPKSGSDMHDYDVPRSLVVRGIAAARCVLGSVTGVSSAVVRADVEARIHQEVLRAMAAVLRDDEKVFGLLAQPWAQDWYAWAGFADEVEYITDIGDVRITALNLVHRFFELCIVTRLAKRGSF